MPRRIAAAALTTVLLAGCGGETETTGTPSPSPDVTVPTGGTGTGGSDPSPTPPTATTPPGSPQAPVRSGTLGGDPNLEGGCVWVDADGQRFELVPADGSALTIDPQTTTIMGPDGQTVAAAGDMIRVSGTVDEDAVSFCQVGPILRVTGVEVG